MAQEVTLGGERLGSGSSMKQELYNYGMNSFNQGRDWKSTMAPGILYPCFKEIGTNFGTFDIDIDTFVRTLPTKGPLFGSFKMQVDLFNVPFRLYQGILHNNPVDIGMKMHQVFLPKLNIQTIDGKGAPKVKGSNENDCQISTSALIKYLGLSGIGHIQGYTTTTGIAKRKFQCIPELGYYDIFKNYYSNKQEENAYVITPGNIRKEYLLRDTEINPGLENYTKLTNWLTNSGNNFYTTSLNANIVKIIDTVITNGNLNNNLITSHISFYQTSIGNQNRTLQQLQEYISWEIIDLPTNEKQLIIAWKNKESYIETYGEGFKIGYIISGMDTPITSDIELTPFNIKNIDKMRAKLLGANEIGDEVIISNEQDQSTIWGTDSGVDRTGLPYSALVKQTEQGINWNAFQQNGLVVKTYQSDLFNNWLDSSFTDEIARRTKIDTTSGGFTPDTLILQEKIYKLLNRILVSGGTYYDWQEATYGEGVARMCEIPMYIGGMSTEIMFEEVVSNSAATAEGQFQALGSLGGKGRNTELKGGQEIHVRMDEPGYIIGIASITPRISVSQGNDWDRTELDSMDDLHKPELDGIGFQDLMAEQLAWWNTVLQPNTGQILNRDAIGKQTAWINYQTAVDKVFGDFAKQDGYSFMVLNRNYEHDEENPYLIKDVTTYIDPAKYNYAFAYTDLAAQNFWVQLNFKVVSRRKMGAQQLPNL